MSQSQQDSDASSNDGLRSEQELALADDGTDSAVDASAGGIEAVVDNVADEAV